MKIISFDVGIKNMAYCLFDISGETIRVIDWKVLSLLDETPPIHHCNCQSIKKNTKKTAPIKLCARVAKFKKRDQFFCDKHANAQTQWRVPQAINLKKMSVEQLTTLSRELGLDISNKKKADAIILLDNFLKEQSLENIIKKKDVRAGDADMVLLGKNMKRIFNDVLKDHLDIKHVLIENQISPLANRMKTVQGMLAQYFIMQYIDIGIEFVSSANKLKMFVGKETGEKTQGQKYKQHKKDGVFYCQQVLDKHPGMSSGVFDTEKKKKDDLADCFLQGIWWLHKEGKFSWDK